MQINKMKDWFRKKLNTIGKYRQINLLLRDAEIYRQEYIYNKLVNLYSPLYRDEFNELEPSQINFLLFHYTSHNLLNHHNLGDYVQTIATQNALRKVFEVKNFNFWERDSLSFYGLRGNYPKACCVMQGWFSYSLNFLPSKNILPVYVGTHLNILAQDVIQRIMCVDPLFLREVEIGCRDLYTYDFCQKLKINSYFSRCLTLTLEKRQCGTNGGRVILVNFPESWESYLPIAMQKSSIRINQQHQLGQDHWENLLSKARELMNFYKESAALVVTTALHCAAPCLAMGIPVVLITNGEENNQRFSALKGLCPVYTLQDLKQKKVPFSSTEPIDIEDLKELLLMNLKLSVEKTLGLANNNEDLINLRNRIARYQVL